MRDSELSLWWAAGSGITAVVVRVLFRVSVEGISNVPVHGPGILAFNHVSVLDGPCLAIETARRRRREARFLVAAEVFRRFFLGWVLRRFDQIPIRRGQGDAHALDEAIETIRGGALAAIAPEGRVIGDGDVELQRIRSGIARIALPTGAVVVPVGIWGTQVRWPRSGLTLRRPWRPRLALTYGEPIDPRFFANGEAAGDALREKVRAGIEAQVRRARVIAGDAP